MREVEQRMAEEKSAKRRKGRGEEEVVVEGERYCW